MELVNSVQWKLGRPIATILVLEMLLMVAESEAADSKSGRTVVGEIHV